MGGSLGWAISSATSLRASPSDANIAQQPRTGILVLLSQAFVPAVSSNAKSQQHHLLLGMLVLGLLL